MPQKLNYPNSTMSAGRFDEPVITFLPAQLKEFPSGWVIEYYALNPESLTMERHREKFQRIRKKLPSDNEARKLAKKICRERNKQLASGWNPYMAGENPRLYTKLVAALELFLKEKLREVRKDTQRVYKSHIALFIQWIERHKMNDLLVQSFTAINADDYLTYKFIEEGKSARTYNNYLTFCRGAFNWMIEKGYCTKNPFSKIKKKKEEEKVRVVIPTEWDKKIMDYCYARNPRLAFVCMLVYSSFLRPAEICRIKIKDIHLDKSAIYIAGRNAKNGHSRWATLTPDTVRMIRELRITECNPEFYMISTSLMPGFRKKETRDIDKHWSRMRKEINLPMKYQLYSYRDTGVMWLKESGVPDYLITELIGHINPEMIQKYSHAPSQEALRLAATFLPKLGERQNIDHAQKSIYSSLYGF